MKIMMGLILAGFASAANAGLKIENVTSVQDGKKFVHYMVSDGSAARHPAVLIAPEWWGITEHDKKTAQELAGKGYAVMVADFYGQGASTLNPDVADKWMTSVQNDKFDFNKRFQAALDALKAQPSVDPARVATVGFGLGGGLAVENARRSSDVKAVVDFFGGLNPTGYAQAEKKEQLRIEKMTPARTITPEILVLVGERDAYVTPDQIKRFTREMKRNEARFKVEVLPAAYHGFTRPGVDQLAAQSKDKLFMSYNAAAEKQAWAQAYQLLEKKLSPSRVPAAVAPAKALPKK